MTFENIKGELRTILEKNRVKRITGELVNEV